MKKLLLGASVLALALAAASCANDNSEKSPAAAAAKGAKDAGHATSLNIRYIDADSVAAHYKLAQKFQEQTLATMANIEKTGQTRQNQIQQLASEIDRKQRSNGYLSQESFEADMTRLNKMQQDAQATLDRMQRQAQEEMGRRQLEMNDSIESFIKSYNTKMGYDAILYKAAGVYFNPALDITDEVVEGLNARYDAGQKK